MRQILLGVVLIIMCVLLALPIVLGAWSMAFMLWQLHEYYEKPSDLHDILLPSLSCLAQTSSLLSFHSCSLTSSSAEVVCFRFLAAAILRDRTVAAVYVSADMSRLSIS